MIFDDSTEFHCALMKFYRHEHPELDLGKTYAITPEYIAKQNEMVAAYNMTFIFDTQANNYDENGFYFATEEDRLFFLLKWGNGTNSYEDI